MRRMNLASLWVCFWLTALASAERHPFAMSHPLQLLEKFGIRDGSLRDSPRVTLGKGKRKGDSPIYYIKLPPMPHFQFNEPQPRFPVSPNTFHQLDVDFTNNGKPEQVYHWNYKPVVPMHTPDLLPQHPQHPNEIFDQVPMPPQIPLLAPVVSKPSRPLPTQKPHISLKKGFVYNGRPNGIYVWKPRPQVIPAKYKHRYFKHFNY